AATALNPHHRGHCRTEVLDRPFHDRIRNGTDRLWFGGLCAALAEPGDGLELVVESPRRHLLRGCPAKALSEQLDSPVDLTAGKPQPDELGLTGFQLERPEVLDGGLPIEV